MRVLWCDGLGTVRNSTDEWPAGRHAELIANQPASGKIGHRYVQGEGHQLARRDDVKGHFKRLGIGLDYRALARLNRIHD